MNAGERRDQSQDQECQVPDVEEIKSRAPRRSQVALGQPGQPCFMSLQRVTLWQGYRFLCWLGGGGCYLVVKMRYKAYNTYR